MRVEVGAGALGVADQDGDEPDRHAGLGDHRAPRGAGDSPAQAVDEDQVEHDVRRETSDRRDEGVRVSCSPRSTPVAARATSIAGMPIAETRRYVVAWPGCCRRGAEHPAQRLGGEGDGHGHHRPDGDGEPGAVDAGLEDPAFRAGADLQATIEVVP